MQTRLTLILLALLLAACAPVVKLAETPVVTSSPTQTPASPTDMPTPEFMPITPTLLPTQPPIPILTPDAIQMERWREYQAELAKATFSSSPELGYDPAIYKDALCEWDILGQSGQEIYVYAACVASKGGVTAPAVIYLESDGSIREVKIPGYKALEYDLDSFPMDVQEKFCFYYFDTSSCTYGARSRPRRDVLLAHIEYRKTHPEEPPLIVLSAPPVSTPTLLPTQPPVSIITPNTIQAEHWREYQKELAKRVLADGGGIFPAYETAVCEWDILGSSNQDVYVWAQCFAPGSGGSGPAVIHLNTDDSVIDVTYAFPGSDRDSRITELFPLDVQEKIDLYFLYWSSDSGIVRELRLHIQYRQTHPDVPPLVILSAMQNATPTP